MAFVLYSHSLSLVLKSFLSPCGVYVSGIYVTALGKLLSLEG